MTLPRKTRIYLKRRISLKRNCHTIFLRINQASIFMRKQEYSTSIQIQTVDELSKLKKKLKQQSMHNIKVTIEKLSRYMTQRYILKIYVTAVYVQPKYNKDVFLRWLDRLERNLAKDLLMLTKTSVPWISK